MELNVFRLVILGVVFVVVAGLIVVTTRRRDDRIDEDLFDNARDQFADSRVMRGALHAAQPLSPFVPRDRQSTLYQAVEERILAAGGAYGGSVEVFLSVQLFMALAGTGLMLLGVSGLVAPAVSLLLGLPVILLPWSRLNQQAKKRRMEVDAALPEFVDLLTMPLTSGITLLASLDFTSQRTTSVVAAEIENMLTLIRSRSMSEAEAFEMCGERLGTPEAKSLMASLAQSHLEGTRVLDTLARQGESLRNMYFQRQREQMRKLPFQLVGVFAIHFLPTVFCVIGLQAVSAFLSV